MSDARARDLFRSLVMDEARAVPVLAAALRQAADEALERAAQAFAESPATQHSGAAVASVLRYLKSPAAAPAAETGIPGDPKCRFGGLFDSEPVAPAPDFRALLVEARAFHPGCKQGTFTKDIERWQFEGWKEGTPFDWRCAVCKRIDAALADGGEGK